MRVHCFCPDLSSDEFAGQDLKEWDFAGKTFYTSRTPMIAHFPVNPELKIKKTLDEIDNKGYRPVSPLFVLFKDGLFTGKVMIEIVPPETRDPNVVNLSDLKLMGKVYSGPKHLVPKALKEFDRYLMSRKYLTTEFFFWYHSCKMCEKKKGNRTVIFGKI